jgi:hypothetical protein
MSPQQVAELLVGIARAQAEVLAAIHTTIEGSDAISPVTQTAKENLSVLSVENKNKPLTLQTLPASVLCSALAKGSNADKTLLETTLKEVSRLLK